MENKYYPGVDIVHGYDNPRIMINDIVNFIEHNEDVNIIGMPDPKHAQVGFMCPETDEVWHISVRYFKKKEYKDCWEIIFGNGPLVYKKHGFFERIRKAAQNGSI